MALSVFAFSRIIIPQIYLVTPESNRTNSIPNSSTALNFLRTVTSHRRDYSYVTRLKFLGATVERQSSVSCCVSLAKTK